VIAGREVEVRRIAHPAELDGVLLAPVRGLRLGEVREGQELGLATPLELSQLRLLGGQGVAQRPRPPLGRRAVLAGALRGGDLLAHPGALRAGGLDPGPQRSGLGVEGEEGVEGAGRVASRKGRAHGVGLGADQPEVEQGAGLTRPARRRPRRGRRGRRPGRRRR
jgi:hypothetical protein